MSLDKLIQAAQEWAARGIPVFPVKSDKSPLTANGFYDAVTEPNKVAELFKFYGDAVWGIGGRMGDGVFAVDLDLYKSNEVKAWYNARIEDGSLVETRTHKTKSGGVHLLYEGEAPDCKPVNGVEVKSSGGYIVLPGTPGYTVEREGISEAPKSLLELLRYSAVAQRGSSVASLEAQVLSGADFHTSLTQLAAKKASSGLDQVSIQKYLLSLLEASTASQPGHERHARWRSVMSDKSGELSRIAASAYIKFNDDALNEEFGEADISDLLAVDDAVFTQLGTNNDKPAIDFNTDVWPFEGQGYFADHQHDLSDVSFAMYPIFAENESVVLFAEPKTGKTAVSVTTALHIACGLHLGALKVNTGGPCLYYALEGSHAIRLRIRSWVQTMRERGVVLPDRIPMFTIEKPANFLKPEARAAAARQIIAADVYSRKFGQPLKVIYIDTLTRAMSGGDQNSVEDTSSLFELVGMCREGGVTACIVFIHHKARQGHVRGSSNIEAEPDMLIDVSKKGEVIKMKIARARSIEDGATFHFAISNVDLGQTKQGHPLNGMFVEPLEDAGTNVDDYAVVQLLVQRREVITQLGMGEHSALDVVTGWHERKLIKGRVVRGSEIPPTLDQSHVKEALATVADDAGGTVYGNFVIRPIPKGGDIAGFKVGAATF